MVTKQDPGACEGRAAWSTGLLPALGRVQRALDGREAQVGGSCVVPEAGLVSAVHAVIQGGVQLTSKALPGH